MVMIKHHEDWGKKDDSDEDIQTMTSVIVKLTLTDNLVNGIGPLVEQGIILYYIRPLPLCVIKCVKQCERSRSK